MEGLIVLIIFAVLVLVIVAKTAIVVPQQSAYVVERLGRYAGTLDAGFHILVPFIDVVRYKAACVNPPKGTPSVDWLKAGMPGAECG